MPGRGLQALLFDRGVKMAHKKNLKRGGSEEQTCGTKEVEDFIDLCPECRRKFSKMIDTLGEDLSAVSGFLDVVSYLDVRGECGMKIKHFNFLVMAMRDKVDSAIEKLW
jgi:hypothetical protein